MRSWPRKHESAFTPPARPVAITIYDIAKVADVSITTVSRAFNEGSRVAPATRERVLKAARELGYRPHASAQNLARRRTQLVSAVVPVVSNYFYMEVIRGMQDALEGTDYDLVVYVAPRPEEVGAQLERATQRGRGDGVLVLSTPLDDDLLPFVRDTRQPVVLVDAVHEDFDSVVVDNERGAYLATRHLLEEGCRRVAHITVAPEPLPARQRRAGYERALAEAGRPAEPALVAGSERRPYGFVEEAGYTSMQRLLGLDAPPDAVFVASDVQALGALRALHEAGRRVPEDVAVVGFDDIALSAYVGLTTLHQPMCEMGRMAMEKLLARIEGGARPTSHTVCTPELVPRQTCWCRYDAHA